MISSLRKSIILLLLSSTAIAKIPEQIDIKKPPPKVIRTCCAFGVDVKVVMLPFIKLTSITAPNLLGQHHFLGNKLENNGIIYTKNGGFIDIGHLRDIADLTAYLYALILDNKQNGLINFKLGREGGLKTISVNIPSDYNEKDLANLAGKIAYDISIWHELSTWFGVSSVPLIAERYSSFSVEDAYSNLLGVHLAIDALLSDEAYEEKMSKNINQALDNLNAETSTDATKAAMLTVKDIWWSSKAKFPTKKLLMLRQYEILNKVSPLLIDETDLTANPNYVLKVPEATATKTPFNNLYELKIKYNLKIPIKKIFGKNYNSDLITQKDFSTLIEYAKTGKY